MFLNKHTSIIALALAFAPLAHANNLVQNGDFESVTLSGGQSSISGEFGSRFSKRQVDNWSTTGYNWVMTATSADTGSNPGEFGSLQLWGPGNGVANGLTASPTGGNYLAADGAYTVAAITQTINGLTIGHTYQLTFDWAAAQQSGFNGDTTDKWTASLGGDSFDTSVVSLPSHGFSGWTHQTFNYTASSASEVLSFLATGTPNGVPPFALLDGVSLVDTSVPSVPDSASTAVLFGLSALALVAAPRLRRQFAK